MPSERAGILSRVAALGLLALLAACAGTGGPAGPVLAEVATQLPPVPSDCTRPFFYRDYEPYESLGRPYVTLNGEVAGISEPSGAFYRDVPAGTYLIAVRSNTFYPDQDKTVTAFSGQTFYVKVASIKGYDSGDSMYDSDTFAVVVVDPVNGQGDIASKRYFSGGS